PALSELPRLPAPAARRSVTRPADREGEEAQTEQDESRREPADVFRKSIIENSKPRQHLPEQPAVQAVWNADRRAASPGPAAVVEAQVDHLDQSVQPREDADAAQLADEQRLCQMRFAERVEDVHGKTEEQGERQQDGADAGEPIGRQPTVARADAGARTKLRDWWNHENR